MKFFIKDFYGKCDQIRSFLRIWSHLLHKSLMENFIFWSMSEVFWEISVLKIADLSKKRTWWNLAAQNFILLSILQVNELFENQDIDNLVAHDFLFL